MAAKGFSAPHQQAVLLRCELSVSHLQLTTPGLKRQQPCHGVLPTLEIRQGFPQQQHAAALGIDGQAGVGGRHGFGAVVPEDEGVRFHADWERRVLGVTLAAAALGHWNIDAARYARESLPPSGLLQRQLLRDLAARARGASRTRRRDRTERARRGACP